MATFKYRAVSRDGAQVDGVVEAYDEYEAVDRIKETCTVVISVAQVEAKAEAAKGLFGTGTIKQKTLALLCSQFSIILTAGMPVVRAVELIRNQMSDKILRQLLSKVAEDVATGHSLAQSFENKGGKLLPTTFIETVRAGEESGTLEASFKRLYEYYDKASKVKARVRSAMMYPIFLSVLAVVVISIVMVVTMPTFITLFESMDIDMPLLTAGLIAVTKFATQYWLIILFVLVVLIVAVKGYSVTEKGSLQFAKLQLNLPLLGKVAQMKGASQFANTMSTLLTSGLPMTRAAAITAKVMDNSFLGMNLGSMSGGLQEGRRLGECLRKTMCFPELLCEMCAMGEETGALEETLRTIGGFYDSEVEIASNKALSMLQPAITIVMGVIIGVIVIALYLPMFSMYSGMS